MYSGEGLSLALNNSHTSVSRRDRQVFNPPFVSNRVQKAKERASQAIAAGACVRRAHGEPEPCDDEPRRR